MTNWHSDADVQAALRCVHDKYARQPDMSKAKPVHDAVTKEIETNLRKEGLLKRIEYTGSAYDGVKVRKTLNDDDIEFDLMLVLEGGKNLTAEVIPNKPGYAILKVSESWSGAGDPTFLAKDINRNALTAQSVDKFMGKIQKLINNSETLKAFNGIYTAKLRFHGTAVQLDVYERKEEHNVLKKLYSVDLVLAVELKCDSVSNNGLDNNPPIIYVPKCKPGYDLTHWRRSYSVQEKAKLSGVDRGNLCHKQVLRLAKIFMRSETLFRSLTSYRFKTALFHEMDHNYSWKHNNLGERFIGVLKLVGECANNREMKHYFVPDFNLLSEYSDITLSNIANRINKLIQNKDTFLKHLNGINWKTTLESLYRANPLQQEHDSDNDEDINEGNLLTTVQVTSAVALAAFGTFGVFSTLQQRRN